MKNAILIVLTSLVFSGCGGGSKPDVYVDPKTAIWINFYIPYKKDAKIDSEIKVKCELPDKLSYFVKRYSDKAGIGVLRATNISKKQNRLELTIDDAVSRGSTYMGQQKYTKASGVLYLKGKQVAKFTAARSSAGGIFSVFKSSCSILGRTVDAMGEDVARWLRIPIDEGHLGDYIK
jgi:hypothetical protein